MSDGRVTTREQKRDVEIPGKPPVGGGQIDIKGPWYTS